MITSAHDLASKPFRRLFSAFAAEPKVAEMPQPVITYGYASAADSTLCPFILKPSSHERLMIDAHRSDWL